MVRGSVDWMGTVDGTASMVRGRDDSVDGGWVYALAAEVDAADEAAARRVVAGHALDVLGEVVDRLCQLRDLHVRGAHVVGVPLVLGLGSLARLGHEVALVEWKVAGGGGVGVGETKALSVCRDRSDPRDYMDEAILYQHVHAPRGA